MLIRLIIFLFFGFVSYSFTEETIHQGNIDEIQQEQMGARHGRLRSTGAFYTELLTNTKGIEVYLLDLEQNNPSIKNSSVEGQLYVANKEYEIRFRSNSSTKKFFAVWPAGMKWPIAVSDADPMLVLLPTREGIMGGPVLYKIQKPKLAKQKAKK